MTIETAQRPSRMTIDLQDYKKPWIQWCKARNTTPSEAFRQVAAKLMRDEATFQAPDGGRESQPDGKIRKEIRLTTSEVAEAEAAALRDGFSLPRWIVALIRARLGKGAQLGQSELEALAASNLRLLAIGRNLNQIAKALNASGADRGLYRIDVIESVEAEVRSHAKAVAAVMSANIERWKGR
jgi:hypothetical protein